MRRNYSSDKMSKERVSELDAHFADAMVFAKDEQIGVEVGDGACAGLLCSTSKLAMPYGSFSIIITSMPGCG